jgi:hypothetical protein
MNQEQSWQEWLEQSGCGDLFDFPEELRCQRWQPAEADRNAAWSFYTEIRTRITTQPLHYRSGDEETALKSVYELFGNTRDILHKHGKECRHFAILAVYTLNQVIRPFTAKWHKKLIEGVLANDDDRRNFRIELANLQSKLRKVVGLFGLLAEGADFCPESETGYRGSGSSSNQSDFDAISFDEIIFSPEIENAAQIRDSEQESIKNRRNAVVQGTGESDPVNVTGLSCSGGGIRSATLCLGVAQRLSENDILKEFDYLSTVSGGGYFGGFLSSYINDADTGEIGPDKDKLPFHQQHSPEPDPIRYLRNNSKFLLKGGILGQTRMLGLLIYGAVVNLIGILPIFFIALFVGQQFESLPNLIQPVFNGLMFALLAFALLLVFFYRFVSSSKILKIFEAIGVGLLLAAITIGVLGILGPKAFEFVANNGAGGQVVAGAALLPLVILIGAFSFGIDKAIGKLLMALAGVTGPLLIYVLFLYLHQGDWFRPGQIPPMEVWFLVLVSVVFLCITNINMFSVHRYYRNRVAETYLIKRDRNANFSVAAVDQQRLSELQTHNPAAPIHLINCALNIPKCKNPNLRGRESDFFLFSKLYCGSPVVGYCATKDLEAADRRMDLGTAVAISGAAASSHMGTQTISGVRFWLSLLNIRLGYWVPNPAKLKKGKFRKLLGPNPLYFLSELFGFLNEQRKYLNVSDGGHIENLGLYELLRRKCKFIVAIDGEADPDMQFGGLITLIRFAEIDLGINIEIDLGDLNKTSSGFSRAHFALGKIHYPQADGEKPQTGFLLYIKSSLTGNESQPIQEYGFKNPTFPHETTADQFFNEAQFEAYRALGYHMAGDLFSREIFSKGGPAGIDDMFRGLADSLFDQ